MSEFEMSVSDKSSGLQREVRIPARGKKIQRHASNSGNMQQTKQKGAIIILRALPSHRNYFYIPSIHAQYTHTFLTSIFHPKAHKDTVDKGNFEEQQCNLK